MADNDIQTQKDILLSSLWTQLEPILKARQNNPYEHDFEQNLKDLDNTDVVLLLNTDDYYEITGAVEEQNWGWISDEDGYFLSNEISDILRSNDDVIKELYESWQMEEDEVEDWLREQASQSDLSFGFNCLNVRYTGEKLMGYNLNIYIDNIDFNDECFPKDFDELYKLLNLTNINKLDYINHLIYRIGNIDNETKTEYYQEISNYLDTLNKHKLCLEKESQTTPQDEQDDFKHIDDLYNYANEQELFAYFEITDDVIKNITKKKLLGDEMLFKNSLSYIVNYQGRIGSEDNEYPININANFSITDIEHTGIEASGCLLLPNIEIKSDISAWNAESTAQINPQNINKHITELIKKGEWDNIIYASKTFNYKIPNTHDNYVAITSSGILKDKNTYKLKELINLGILDIDICSDKLGGLLHATISPSVVKTLLTLGIDQQITNEHGITWLESKPELHKILSDFEKTSLKADLGSALKQETGRKLKV